jgi:hypothetical protein
MRLLLLCVCAQVVFADFYVSTAGKDSNNGTSVGFAFKTLHHAKDAARSAQRPVTIHVGSGNFFLGNTSLVLGTADGGGVHWKGASDGSSHVYGGSRIEGWEQWAHSANIYRAKWSGARFYSMVEGTAVATMAREPDSGSGYLPLTKKDSSTVGWQAGSLPEAFTCNETHQCQAYLQCNYFSETHNVVLGSVNFTTRTLKYESQPHCRMRMGLGGVYLSGALEFLNAPGEFAIAAGWVYYWPIDSSTAIEDLTIVAAIPQRSVAFVAASASAPVTDISMSNLVFIGSGANYSWLIGWDNGPTSAQGEGYQSNYLLTAMQQGQLYFENASSIRVSGCELIGAGHSGVWMQGVSSNNMK